MLNNTCSTVDDEVECPEYPKKLTGISCDVSQCGDMGMVGKYPKYVPKYSHLCVVLTRSPVRGVFAIDRVSTHRPMLSPHLEAALTKIKVLSQ